MQFDEKGFMTGKTMMLLPGTACDYQTNFGSVLDALEDKYHVICVNYDGFDGSHVHGHTENRAVYPGTF